MVTDFSELSFPTDRWLYVNNTPYHYWVRENGENNNGLVTIGLNDFFQKQIGEINSVSFNISLHKPVAKSKVLSLVKAKNYSAILRFPFSCEVVEINESLKKHPKLINESPYEKGWLVKIQPSPPFKEQLTEDWIDLSQSESMNKLKAFIDQEIKNKSLLADDCCPDFLGGSGVTRRRRN